MVVVPSPSKHRYRLRHRRHAIIEIVFADLIDGPLAHVPSSRFGAEFSLGIVRRDRTQLAAHHWRDRRDSPRRLTRATLRRKIYNIPARLARPQRRLVLHLAQPLALGARMACAVAQHNRLYPPTTCLTQ